MQTQNPVQVSRAHRRAYTCGMSVKRGYRKLKTFEYRVVERAVTAGMPAGKLLVRGSFDFQTGIDRRIAFCQCLDGYFHCDDAGCHYFAMAQGFYWCRSTRENPGPDYLGADLYIGDFDDNGHYIGDSKSSN